MHLSARRRSRAGQRPPQRTGLRRPQTLLPAKPDGPDSGVTEAGNCCWSWLPVSVLMAGIEALSRHTATVAKVRNTLRHGVRVLLKG